MTDAARAALTNERYPLAPDVEVVAAEPVMLNLLRYQVFFCDGHFLLLRVARNLDNLHTISQRARDGLESVRSGDEQHLRQQELIAQRSSGHNQFGTDLGEVKRKV